MKNLCIGMIVSLCLVLCGCSSTRILPATTYQQVVQHIETGDDVVITLKNGQEQLVHVTEINKEYLSGRTANYRYTYIAKITVEELSILKSAGLAFGIVIISAGIGIGMGQGQGPND